MRIYVCPSSGGRFANQLSLLIAIHNILPIPDAILATSGGNLCSYIALAGNFTPEGIMRISKLINSSLFSTPWWPKYLNFIPSWIIGTFKGSIYKEGSGSTSLMRSIFTSENISRVEILTGTTERSTGKHQIFSNKSQSNSFTAGICLDCDMINCNPVKYVNGDIETIAKVCAASASIPVYVPDKKIDDKYYIDGGTTYWSPLAALYESLDGMHKEKTLHIDYFNSSDIESNLRTDNYYNIVQNTDNTFDRLIKSIAVSDRYSGIELVRLCNIRYSSEILYGLGVYSRETLTHIETVRLKYGRRSFLELYSSLNLELDITDFNGNDVINNIELVSNHIRYRFWIAVDPKYVEKVRSELGVEKCNSVDNCRKNAQKH